jgi:hypothetical protein
MSESAIRILVALVFIAHGLGHGLAALPFVGFKLSKPHSAESWILSDRIGKRNARVACLVIHTIALILFVAAGAALAGWGFHGRDWEALAVSGALFSSFGLILFWNAFPFLVPNKVGVILVNGATLLFVLVLR